MNLLPVDAIVLVLVLEETVNNNFLFTFSMSFMLSQIPFHSSSFSRLKSPGLFIRALYERYFMTLIALVVLLENFPSSTTSLLKVRREGGKESILS